MTTMQRYTLPKLESPQALAERVKNIYIAKKEINRKSPNPKRLYAIDLINFLPDSLDDMQNSFESICLGAMKPYAEEDIYSLANGDFLGSIKASQRVEDDTDVNSIKLDELKAGILIFIDENIRRKENKGGVSEKKRGFLNLYTTGSELVETIKEILMNCKENKLQDEDRFIYLSDLYHHVEEGFPSRLNHPFWGTKSQLLNDIVLAMLQVKKRDEERVKLLTQGIPKLNMLLKYLREVNEAYRKDASARLFTFLNAGNRLDILDFAEFVGKACEETLTIDNYKETCDAVIGLILLGIMRIQADYIYLFSPKGSYLTNGSELWKGLTGLLGVDINEISYDDRIKYLRTLTNKIASVLKPEMEDVRRKWIQEIKDNEGLYDLKKAECDTMKKVEAHQAKANIYIGKLEIEKKQPCLATRCVSKGISVSAQGIISWAVAANVMPLVGGLTAGVLGGPVGVVVYAAAGTIVMSKLGGVIPGPVSWVYGWALHKIGNAIGEGTVKAAKYTFSMGKNGLNQLLGHEAIKKEDRKFIDRYIDAILKAPKEVVSDKEKLQLRLALGRDEPELTLTQRLG